jgi:hypothetical protein
MVAICTSRFNIKQLLNFIFMGSVWFSLQTAIISLNSVNYLIAVMMKCGVLFEVRTEFLNNIKRALALKG